MKAAFARLERVTTWAGFVGAWLVLVGAAVAICSVTL